MTRWDIPPVSLGKSWVIVVGVWFGLWPRFLFCFAVFSRWRYANLAGGFACRLLVFVLLVVLCDPICRFPDETTVFHAEFLIRLSAYPNVRTEPQSDIGHNRGKKRILWERAAKYECAVATPGVIQHVPRVPRQRWCSEAMCFMTFNDSLQWSIETSIMVFWFIAFLTIITTVIATMISW